MNNFNRIRRFFLFLLPILFLFSQSFAQTPQIKIATENEIKEQIKSVPCKNAERLDAVKKLFQTMGATDADISIEKFDDVQNLVVKKKGKTEETVIVGAHYDKIGDGCGVIDNWSGIVIIANLYRTMKDTVTNKTYLFVAFDEEESGLRGSMEMAKAIPKDKRASYCAMVNLDSFGFNYPQGLDNSSTSEMTELAVTLGKELKMPFSHSTINEMAYADSYSFRERGVPAITFHGLSKDWKSYLHTWKDKVENVNASSVLVGYNFALQYLIKIEASPCNVFR